MKAYVKPELFVERYELSQHIATCGIDVTYTDGCTGNLDPDFWGGLSDPVFNQDQQGCSTAIEKIEVYCYTNGATVAGRLFNS